MCMPSQMLLALSDQQGLMLEAQGAVATGLRQESLANKIAAVGEAQLLRHASSHSPYQLLSPPSSGDFDSAPQQPAAPISLYVKGLPCDASELML